MPEITNISLKIARESLKIPRWKLAAELHVSESTIERWETGETQPHPDEVDRLAVALGDPMLWHGWMLSNYESYRRRYIHCDDRDLPVALMHVRHEVADLLELQDRIERDSVDGKIDDATLSAAYASEIRELVPALINGLQRLVPQEGGPYGR